MLRWLSDLFSHPSPNPDVVGLFKITAAEIDYEAHERDERKLREAKAYLDERRIKVKPIIKVRQP